MKFIKVEVLEVIEPKSYIIQCGYCKGRGLKTYSMDGYSIKSYCDTTKCPVCNGKGIIEIHADDILIFDSFCKGTGHHPYSNQSACDTTICKNCNGSGVQSLIGNCKIIR